MQNLIPYSHFQSVTAACKWNADLCLSLCASSGLNLLHSTLSQSIAVEGDWVRNVCGEGGCVHACFGGWGGEGGSPCAYVHICALVQFLNGCVTPMIVPLNIGVNHLLTWK